MMKLLKNEFPGWKYKVSRIKSIFSPNITLHDDKSGMKIEKNVLIPMRDGVSLCANIFRPLGDKPTPVIMSAHPYGKDSFCIKGAWRNRFRFSYRISHQIKPITLSTWTSWEAPDPVFWVKKGYTVINLDTRGFHQSPGVASVLSDQEAQDYYDAIEWAAEQSWSNGSVGLCGLSYLSISQWKVAALPPPSLKAICPWEGFTDAYRDFFYHGGIREQGFSAIWLRTVAKSGKLKIDYSMEVKHRKLRDLFYKKMIPPLEKITVPALIGATFSDQDMHTPGSFRAFCNINSPQKWVYTHRGPKWATFYSSEALACQLKFFNHFLKQENNGWEKTPPVRLEVRDTHNEITVVRWIENWPPKDIAWQKLYLQFSTGQLNIEPPLLKDQADIALHLPAGRIDFYYTIERDTQIIGPMLLAMGAYFDKICDARLFVKVWKYSDGVNVPFEGTLGYGYDSVSQGFLRVNLNDKDFTIETCYQSEPAYDRQLVIQPKQ